MVMTVQHIRAGLGLSSVGRRTGEEMLHLLFSMLKEIDLLFLLFYLSDPLLSMLGALYKSTRNFWLLTEPLDRIC